MKIWSTTLLHFHIKVPADLPTLRFTQNYQEVFPLTRENTTMFRKLRMIFITVLKLRTLNVVTWTLHSQSVLHVSR